jgi:hypothetical protein
MLGQSKQLRRVALGVLPASVAMINAACLMSDDVSSIKKGGASV